MSVEQDVLNASNPKEALLVLARAVDALAAKQATPTLDSWEGWGDAPSSALPDDRAIMEQSPDGAVMVDIPTAKTEWQKEMRQQFVDEVMHNDFDEVICKAFKKAGPLYLYYGNRDYVMGLSEDWRRNFVKDVEVHSAPEAQEMSRDVLKDMEAAAQNMARDAGAPDIPDFSA